MRLLWFLPLAFIAGSHGFALFVPYLLLIRAAFHLRRERRRARSARRRAVVASPEPIPSLLNPPVAVAAA